jgi:TfoX/Sxy family transcriptional regulator of competence genes
MPYNEELDSRIKKVVSRWNNTDDKKMFGGVCHLQSGNMFCGVYKDYLILRLGENRAEEVLKQSFARPFDITGRKMKGWVMVDAKGYKEDEDLKSWLAKARKFAKTLPEK